MTRLLHILVPSVAVAGALTWSQPWVAGSDLWWHLASGREIWTRGAVLSTDPFSYTFAGREWMNHEWLWDVLYWGLYHQIGPQAVAWFHLGVVALLYALIYGVAWRESRSVFAAGAVVWLSAAAMYWFMDIRPHVYTLVIVSAFLLTRDRRWAPFVWPPLMVIWVNLHGGFVFGLGMIGLHVLVKTVEAGVRERPAPGGHGEDVAAVQNAARPGHCRTHAGATPCSRRGKHPMQCWLTCRTSLK